MKHLLFSAILLACCATGPLSHRAHAASGDQACAGSDALPRVQRELPGSWKHVELIRVVDGNRLSPQPSRGESIARFYCDGTWDLIGPNYRSAGTFRWVGEDTIEQTIVESNLAIQIGLVNVKRIIVDGRRLEMQVEQTAEQRAQVMPPPTNGIRREIATLVITRFERVEK